MIKVLLESPFAGKGGTDSERRRSEANNIRYARTCLHDCFQRGEAPFASHLLYTQEGVLDDGVAEERRLGIEAGLIWGQEAEKSVFYLDRGYSSGMNHGLLDALVKGRPFEFRAFGLDGSASLVKAFFDYLSRHGSRPKTDVSFMTSGIHKQLIAAHSKVSDTQTLPEFLTMLNDRSW